MSLTKTALSKLLSNQVIYKKTKKNYDKEILNLYENIILSFMKKNKIAYFHIAPIHSEDEDPCYLPSLQESNLNYEELNCLLNQPITLTIQEKIVNYIIAESLFSNKLESLINGKYWGEYDKEMRKVISLYEIIKEIINSLIDSREISSNCDIVFINKNKSLKIKQQKNIGKRIKREQKTRQAIEWQERYKEYEKSRR